MITRTVKYNLRSFIEDYILFYEEKDMESVGYIMADFLHFYNNSDDKIKDGIDRYLTSNKIAKQYPDIQAVIHKCTLFSLK
jgi:hypothetical protein